MTQSSVPTLMGLPCSPANISRFAAAPQGQSAARDLVRVEHMQGPAEIDGEEVGDVGEHVDRPQPDRGEAGFQPVRALAVGDAAHRAAQHPRTGFGKLVTPGDGAGAGSGDSARRKFDQRAEPGGGKVARHAAYRQRIAAIGGDADFDHRIVQPGPMGIGGADRRIFRQLDDAVMILAEPELACGDQHAFGFDAADFAHLQGDAGARHVGAGRRKYHFQPGARIRRTAHHGKLGVAGIHAAGAQPVGIRVLHRLDDLGDDERGQRRGAVLDAFHLQPDGGEGGDDLIERGLGLQPGFQPGKSELHRS